MTVNVTVSGPGITTLNAGKVLADPIYFGYVDITYPWVDPYQTQIQFVTERAYYARSIGGVNGNDLGQSGTLLKGLLNQYWNRVLSNPQWRYVYPAEPYSYALVQAGPTDLIFENVSKLVIDFLQISNSPATQWWLDSGFAKYGFWQTGRGVYEPVIWLNQMNNSVVAKHGPMFGGKIMVNQGFVAQVNMYQSFQIPPLQYDSYYDGSGTYPTETQYVAG